jgi:hypothetical protein
MGKFWKSEQPFPYELVHIQAGFFTDLSPGAFFGCLAGLQFSTQPVPFSLMDIIPFFDPMHHQSLAVFSNIAQCGKFQ